MGTAVSEHTEGKILRRVADETTVAGIMLRALQVQSNAFLPDTVTVFGERFSVELVGNDVFLTHPQWSLLGVGPSIGAAKMNLLDEARDVAEAMDDDDDNTLSPEARKLKLFAQRVAAR
jgi:hypothetical protein